MPGIGYELAAAIVRENLMADRPWNFDPLGQAAVQGAVAEVLSQLDKLETENARLNRWADSFSNSALKERATGEAYQRELRDDLASLRADYQAVCEENQRNIAARQSAQASNASLVGALEVFAKAAEEWDAEEGEEFPPTDDQRVWPTFYIGDFRRARQALSALESGEAAADNNRKGAETETDRHRFGSPPEPVVNPNEKWCDAYADWYYQGSR